MLISFLEACSNLSIPWGENRQSTCLEEEEEKFLSGIYQAQSMRAPGTKCLICQSSWDVSPDSESPWEVQEETDAYASCAKGHRGDGEQLLLFLSPTAPCTG